MSIDFGALGGPPPVVDPADLRRVWTVLQSEKQSGTLRQGTAIDQRLLSQDCTPSCNVVAAFVRASLLDALVEQGLLKAWLGKTGLPDQVFELAARFVFSGDPGDLELFVRALQQE
jgi:hypothetical protein